MIIIIIMVIYNIYNYNILQILQKMWFFHNPGWLYLVFHNLGWLYLVFQQDFITLVNSTVSRDPYKKNNYLI